MRHLSLQEVGLIQGLVIEQFGGSEGERDSAGLKSALAQPGAEYFGEPIHSTVAEQAAAYLFHLCQAHAFVDGNKRTAVFCALAFLHLNGYRLSATDEQLFEVVVKVARGQMDKPVLSKQLKGWLEERS